MTKSVVHTVERRAFRNMFHIDAERYDWTIDIFSLSLHSLAFSLFLFLSFSLWLLGFFDAYIETCPLPLADRICVVCRYARYCWRTCSGEPDKCRNLYLWKNSEVKTNVSLLLAYIAKLDIFQARYTLSLLHSVLRETMTMHGLARIQSISDEHVIRGTCRYESSRNTCESLA